MNEQDITRDIFRNARRTWLHLAGVTILNALFYASLRAAGYSENLCFSLATASTVINIVVPFLAAPSPSDLGTRLAIATKMVLIPTAAIATGIIIAGPATQTVISEWTRSVASAPTITPTPTTVPLPTITPDPIASIPPDSIQQIHAPGISIPLAVFTLLSIITGIYHLIPVVYNWFFPQFRGRLILEETLSNPSQYSRRKTIYLKASYRQRLGNFNGKKIEIITRPTDFLLRIFNTSRLENIMITVRPLRRKGRRKLAVRLTIKRRNRNTREIVMKPNQVVKIDQNIRLKWELDRWEEWFYSIYEET